jgi:hypothetical protein
MKIPWTSHPCSRHLQSNPLGRCHFSLHSELTKRNLTRYEITRGVGTSGTWWRLFHGECFTRLTSIGSLIYLWGGTLDSVNNYQTSQLIELLLFAFEIWLPKSHISLTYLAPPPPAIENQPLVTAAIEPPQGCWKYFSWAITMPRDRSPPPRVPISKQGESQPEAALQQIR